jgi:hypothetical protein
MGMATTLHRAIVLDRGAAGRGARARRSRAGDSRVLRRRRKQAAEPDRGREGKIHATRPAAMPQLPQPADRLHPAEGLLDQFAPPLTSGVPGSSV